MPLYQNALLARITAHRRRFHHRRAIREIQSDPHLARDIGLEFKPRAKPGKDTLW